MLRKALVATGALILTLAATSVALADNGPHVKDAVATDAVCAGCHRAHTGPAAEILTEAGGQGALCLSCHDGTSADNNVLDGVEKGTSECLRGGGFTNARIDAGAGYDQSVGADSHKIACGAAEAAVSKHNYGSTGTIWGFGNVNGSPNPGQASYRLECGSCHNPHGNGNYRILRIPPTGVTPVTASPNMGDEGATKTYTITDYWRPSYAESSSPSREMTKWCAQCHSRHTAIGAGSGSTDSGDAIFAFRHRVDGTTASVIPACTNCHGGTGARTVTLSCIKCHVAHGSNATVTAEAVTVPYPGGGAGNEGGSLLRMDNRGVCQRCHGK